VTDEKCSGSMAVISFDLILRDLGVVEGGSDRLSWVNRIRMIGNAKV